MSETNWLRLLGAGLIVWGLKLIFFGGTKQTSGSYFELFGFEFGSSEREPMGPFERWFVGLALIAGGAFLLKHLH